MNSFIQRHTDKIVGVLNGYDRLVLRGTLRAIVLVAGMKAFLWKRRVLLKDFGSYVQAVTNEIMGATYAAAERLGRPVRYLPSAQTNKEVHQSEWATDVMFRDAASLAALYRPLVLHGITTFSSGDVMRFLGRKLYPSFQGEVVSDLRARTEGIRIKHRVGQNSVKAYDKQGSVLRVETTINDPSGFKVFRTKEGESRGKPEWLPMRKGIADLHRRAQVSQASNERYLEALAAVDTETPFGDLLDSVSRPVTWNGARVRGLRPWATDDLALLRAVSRGEFCVNGFRNRDLQPLLFEKPAASPKDHRRRSGRVSRLLRLLRAHGLIRKLPKSHRYKLSERGRQLATALLAAHDLSLEQINRAAA